MNNTPKMPTNYDLNIMWAVATSSAIETREKPHLIFARLLYYDITNSGPDVKLAD
jgi:hypothetical protein